MSRPARRETARGIRAGKWGSFELFAEMLLAGLIFFVFSLGIVTSVAGLSAAVSHLRRHIDGERSSLKDVMSDFRLALPGSLAWGALSVALIFAVAGNVLIVMLFDVQGGLAIACVTIICAISASIVIIHAGVGRAVRPSGSWRLEFQHAAQRSIRDFQGSIWTAVAILGAVLLVWMFFPLIVIAGGLIVFAGLVIDLRRVSTPDRS